MKRAYAASKYAKPYEQYCREQFPDEAAAIFEKAEVWYRRFLQDSLPCPLEKDTKTLPCAQKHRRGSLCVSARFCQGAF